LATSERVKYSEGAPGWKFCFNSFNWFSSPLNSFNSSSGISRKEASINLVQWAYKKSYKAETDNVETGIVVLVASIQFTNGNEELHKAPFRIYFIITDKTISYRITDMTVARYPIEVRYEHGKKRPAMGYNYAFIDIDEKINELILEFSKVNQK
jgi:hypothetical protein